MNTSSSPDAGGHLDLEFRKVRGRSYVTRRHYRWPFSIGRQFSLSDAPETATIVLQTVSGTINAGDRTTTSISVQEGAMARLLPQGAVSVHRAERAGEGAFESTNLRIGPSAVLEHRMGSRILFPRARYGQRLRIQVADSGFAAIQDGIVIIGGNSGNYVEEYFSETVIEVDGVPRARERSRINDWSSLPELVRRRSAFGQILIVDPAGSLGSFVPDSPPVTIAYAAVSALPGGVGMILRVAAEDGGTLRAVTDRYLTELRKRRSERARRSAT